MYIHIYIYTYIYIYIHYVYIVQIDEGVMRRSVIIFLYVQILRPCYRSETPRPRIEFFLNIIHTMVFIGLFMLTDITSSHQRIFFYLFQSLATVYLVFRCAFHDNIRSLSKGITVVFHFKKLTLLFHYFVISLS